VELAVDGARAESTPAGVRLVLADGARKLAYGRLKVTDANGRELAARMEVLPVGDEVTSLASAPGGGQIPSQSLLTSAATGGRLAVVVADADAAYPVRIDPTFSDADWVSLTSLNGASGMVRAMTVDGTGNLYVGGDFGVIGSVQTSLIAKWDGTAWSALGGGVSGGNGRVFCIAVIGNNVYVGGHFEFAGGVPVHRLAMWNGATWSALGSGISGSIEVAASGEAVYAFAVSGTDLYVGGSFAQAGGITVNGVAKWSGTAWSALTSGLGPTGGGSPNVAVKALAASGNNLYVGGRFKTAGGIAATNVALWTGAAWSSVGTGSANGVPETQTITALAVSGNNLYVGGSFAKAGGVSAANIARWNGSAWFALGTGLTGNVDALALDGSGNLYAGGRFQAAGGTAATGIAKWNGIMWSALGTGMVARDFGLAAVSALAVDASGNLYAGGDFVTAGGTAALRIAKWNGSAWSALGQGNDGTNDGTGAGVRAIARSGADIYIAGDFTTFGGVPANRIAKWNGTAWSALGTGPNGLVLALAVDASGNLYAGGFFTLAGGTPANRIAKWSGNAWSALGMGLADSVSALAVIGTDVYAGGTFGSAGGGTAKAIAKWNGNAWSALGSGLALVGSTSGSEVVNALTVSGTSLYVGGNFTTAGGITVNNIAKWDGTAWSALGSGLGSFQTQVNALLASGSDLYAGGNISVAGSSYIAKWNGTAWSALGTGLGDVPLAFAVDAGGNLYAGGGFTTAGGLPANRIAMWDGTAWSALGSGVGSSSVRALLVGDAGLYVGGAFTTVGAGTVSPNFALAKLGPPSIASVTGPSAGGYKAGAVLTFTVTFSGPVTVTGTPQLGLTIGSTTRQASYVSGSGGTALTFTYTVQPGENDPDGIAVASPVALNGGSIGNALGASVLDFTPPTTAAVFVDTLPPTVLSVVRLNPGPQLLAAGTRQVVFRVTYSEAVTNVIPAGFSILNVGGGTVTGTIGTPTGGPAVYDVPVSITGGSGEFRLRVNQ